MEDNRFFHHYWNYQNQQKNGGKAIKPQAQKTLFSLEVIAN
jgi:hypothetical protein